MGGHRGPDARDVFARRNGGKGKRNRPKAEFKQAAAVGAHHVIVTFLRRVLEKADLGVVEADQRVEVARPGDLVGPAFVGLFIRQQNLGR